MVKGSLGIKAPQPKTAWQSQAVFSTEERPFVQGRKRECPACQGQRAVGALASEFCFAKLHP